MTKTLSMVLVAALAAGGCSWGAHGVRAVASAPCSPSRVVPFVDTAIAAAGAGAFVYGLSRGLSDEPGDHRSTFLGIGSSTAIVFAAAAISGHTWANGCHAASR